MRSMWKGVVSFGLVSIPVKMYAATEEHDVPLRQVHAKDGARVRYKRYCEAEGVEVPYAEIAKGYEMPDGQTVVLSEDDLSALPLATNRSVEVLRFVPAEQIDGIYLAKSYFLQADGPGAKPYVLLRDALTKAGTVALVKVALRQRESLAMLRANDGVLVLQTMLWPDEIRDASGIAPPADIDIRPQEMQMAASYIDTLTGDFDPAEFDDAYATALRALVEEKVAGHEVTRPPEADTSGAEVIDLMAALQASVEQAKANRPAAAKKPATKKPAQASAPKAKKAPAKKAAKATAARAKKSA